MSFESSSPHPHPLPELATRTDALKQAAQSAIDYLEGLDARPVAPKPESVADMRALCAPLPESETDPAEVVRLLSDLGGPASMAISGGRFFGFVIGGCLPAAMAASWLVNTWDQNAGLWVVSPAAADLEDTAAQLGYASCSDCPEGTAGEVVTGATVANFMARRGAPSFARTRRLGRGGRDGIPRRAGDPGSCGRRRWISSCSNRSPCLGSARSAWSAVPARLPVDACAPTRCRASTNARFSACRRATSTQGSPRSR